MARITTGLLSDLGGRGGSGCLAVAVQLNSGPVERVGSRPRLALAPVAARPYPADMTDRPRHPLALSSGTLLGGTATDGRRVSYVHAEVADDVLAAAGVLVGDVELVAAVRATLDGCDDHIDGDDDRVFMQSLAEVHPTGSSTVVPTMKWFLWRESDNLPDMALSIAAVLPSGSVVNLALNEYLYVVQDYRDAMALLDADG